MTRLIFQICSLFCLWTAAMVSPVKAEPIGAGETVIFSRAIQDITLLPGTPFNPSTSPIVIDDLFGIGPLTIFRDAQVGNTITFSMLDGRFFGSHPALGDYVFGRIDPLTPSTYSGQIVNVVQNPADPGFATGQPSSFVSGDITWGGTVSALSSLPAPLQAFACIPIRLFRSRSPLRMTGYHHRQVR